MATTMNMSGIGQYPEATEPQASVVSEAEAVSMIQQKNAIVATTRGHVHALCHKVNSLVSGIFALTLLATPACTDKPVQESFVNLNSGIPDATLSKPADTAAIAPVSQSLAQGDNVKLPANAIAQFNASATTPVAETTPAVTEAPEKAPSGRPAWAEGIKYKGTADGVLAFKQFIDAKTNNPEVIVTPSEAIKIKPNETVNIQLLSPVSSDGKGLEQLANTGTLLTKQTFEKVTHQDSLTEANYKTEVVPALYDMSDIETWLTNSDGTPMDADGFASYKKKMGIVKNNWLGKLDEYKQAGKQELIDRWLSLYNEYLPKVIHGSREEYRRLLTATNALALAQEEYTNAVPNFNARVIPGGNGKTIDDVLSELRKLEEKQNSARNTEEELAIEKEKDGLWNDLEARYDPAVRYTPQLGELILMTYDKSTLIKLERRDTKTGDTLKYIIPSDRDMEEWLHFKPGIYTTQHALAWWNAQQENAYMDTVELAELDADNAQLDADIAAGEARIAAGEARIKKLDSDIGVLDTYHDTLRVSNALAEKIQGEFTNLPKNTEDTYAEYVKNLQADMKEFARLTRKLQTLPDDDPAFKAIIDEHLLVIQKMAKAYQIPFPTT